MLSVRSFTVLPVTFRFESPGLFCVLVGGGQVSFSSVHLNAPVVVGSVGSGDHTWELGFLYAHP